MKDEKKKVIYERLRQLYPNLEEKTLILITESSLDLLAWENAEINFPLELLSEPINITKDTKGHIIKEDEWKWEINLK